MALFRDTWAELAEILFKVVDSIGFTLKLYDHADDQMSGLDGSESPPPSLCPPSPPPSATTAQTQVNTLMMWR